MLPISEFKRRRQELAKRFDGTVLLVGNDRRYRNLPSLELPFRQDSNFLYFTGCALPGAAAILAHGSCSLFLPEPAVDDALWHGPTPTFSEIQRTLGLDAVRPIHELEHVCKKLGALASIAIPDVRANQRAIDWTGERLVYPSEPGTPALIDAIVALRRKKSPTELAAMRDAAAITVDAHRTAMAATHPGETEQSVGALFDAVVHSRSATPGYPSIVTVHGEILHSFHREHTLENGQLLLLDGGAEVPSGYGCDVTRTWPVNGTYSSRQRAAYQAVLEAQSASIALCTAGVRYRKVHDASSQIIARFLKDEGLLRCSPEDAVECGAHALFFPHGVGHLLGLDVHDLESFGDRAQYAEGRERSDQFGTGYLRLDIDLEPGIIVTVEPGFYVVPSILGNDDLRTHFRDVVDWERAAEWVGFGGIRIEDDVVVTENEPEVLTAAAPRSINAIEAIVGSGTPASERLRA
jgi:Xaa-Pro aminopeptidase